MRSFSVKVPEPSAQERNLKYVGKSPDPLQADSAEAENSAPICPSLLANLTLPRASLAPQLAQMKSANPKIKVHLRGDARLNYGAIAVVAGEIRNGGIQVIALRTDLANLKSEIEAFPKENGQ